MIARENIRSGRKANFFITENSFVDNYAKAVGPVCTVIYNVLERYMNCETRSTFVGTAKIAETVGVTQRTVQRCLKTLEEFRLIKILKDASTTTYVVVPVPPRGKTATIPLFEALDDKDILWNSDNKVAEATEESDSTTAQSHDTTPTSYVRDTGDTAYKEEQNVFNKTSQQEQSKHLSPSIYKLAGRVASLVNLPLTPGNLRTIEAAITAEAERTGRSVQEAAEFIGKTAANDADRGVNINKYYFEDAKWRQEGRVYGRFNRAEQRKLDNLEVNARFQQRLKERFGHS